MENREKQGALLFAVNGERFELTDVDPSTTLLEFLRTQTRFKSVKLGCGEASGEPPLLLAASVHCATRAAIKEARKQLHSWSNLDEPYSTFQLEVPATMPVVKELCGLDIVERYLKWKMGKM